MILDYKILVPVKSINLLQLINILLVFTFVNLQKSIAQDDAWNVDLFAEINRGDSRYSGSWAYIDELGNEYGLVGARTGLAAYLINDGSTFDELGFIPGPSSNWREIMVLGEYAYVCTEGSGLGEGMQVVDLSYLPDSLHLLTTYDSTFTTGHILQRDIYSEAPYIYVNGVCNDCGVNIIDVSDPAEPLEAGTYSPGYYIHDCMVKGDLMFASAFHNGTLDIVDISDKTNPFLMTQIEIPGGRVHSSWVTENDQYLFVCAEQDGLPARVYDISDLENIFEVVQWSANLESLVHNPYIKGDLNIISHNTEGLRILDLADPRLPVEIGYYDTFGGESGGFNGLWSACPFFPSGKVIGGDRTRGLMVWTFDESIRASRIFGLVRDSISQMPINNAQIIIAPDAELLNSDILGEFKYGLIEGDLTITVQRGGYMPKEFQISLNQGDNIDLVVDLVPNDFVSVSEVDKNQFVKVFPNPANTTSLIEYSGNDLIQTLLVYDVDGRNVFSEEKINNTSVTLQDCKLMPGLYFYEIKNIKGKVIGAGKFIWE